MRLAAQSYRRSTLSLVCVQGRQCGSAFFVPQRSANANLWRSNNADKLRLDAYGMKQLEFIATRQGSICESSFEIAFTFQPVRTAKSQTKVLIASIEHGQQRRSCSLWDSNWQPLIQQVVLLYAELRVQWQSPSEGFRGIVTSKRQRLGLNDVLLQLPPNNDMTRR